MNWTWVSPLGMGLDLLGGLVLFAEWVLAYREDVRAETNRRNLAGRTFLGDGKPRDIAVINATVHREARPRLYIPGAGLLLIVFGFALQFAAAIYTN